MSASTRDLRRMLRRAERRCRRLFPAVNWVAPSSALVLPPAWHASDRRVVELSQELKRRGVDPWEHDPCPF